MSDRFYREPTTPEQAAIDDVSRLYMNLMHNRETLFADLRLTEEDKERFDRLAGDLVWVSKSLRRRAHGGAE